jgi:glycosyltransferase involved in cell wall biosynthesis
MNNAADIRQKAREMGCVAVIPVFNNAGTVGDVVGRVKRYMDDVIVVNDGSSDGTSEILAGIGGIEIISYSDNRGKGHALRRGLAAAGGRGFRYALTIDADGQHFPEDIPLFLEQAELTPGALVIGARNLTQENMPAKNTFANRFSNFWFRLETGKKMDDTQSGFRLYPLRPLHGMRFITSRYEFELESAVRLAWKGVAVVNIPVRVYYAPEGERVSHFKPFRDFARISLLNSVLVIVALLWYYPVKFVKWLSWRNFVKFVRENITHSGESNVRLSAAVGWGVMWGIMPVWGWQMVIAGVTAHLLKLNKIVTVASSNISIPPMIPLILFGSFATGGAILGRGLNFAPGDITFESIAGSLVQYLIGSVVLAVTAGVVMWLVSYVLLKTLRKDPVDG